MIRGIWTTDLSTNISGSHSHAANEQNALISINRICALTCPTLICQGYDPFHFQNQMSQLITSEHVTHYCRPDPPRIHTQSLSQGSVELSFNECQRHLTLTLRRQHQIVGRNISSLHYQYHRESDSSCQYTGIKTILNLETT